MEVLIIQRAVDQLESNYRWWAENRSPEQAARWYNAFLETILSLESNPQRWALAEENEEFPFQVRELHFGLGSQPFFRPNDVLVFSIRHVSQSRVTPDNY